MTGQYILEGHTPRLAEDVMEWARWYETGNRRVAETKKDGVYISTVFLGLDHSFGGGVPILFETMVFGGEYREEMERYSTWDEAEEGHKRMVAKVFGEEK